jgi:60 kDa SS-A/Ro ribonucleoprotein
MTPRVAGAAMAMVTMRSEPQYYIAGFMTRIRQLALRPEMSLSDVVAYTALLQMGGTDCALPMLDATQKKIPADVFIVITDSETWAGKIHPSVALKQYRQAMGIDAKLIVMGLVSNGFSIADPNDAGQMDVVGFDASVPQVMAQFIGGEYQGAVLETSDDELPDERQN